MIDPWTWITGRIGIDSFSLVVAWQNPTTSELIGAGAASVVVIGGALTVALLTWFRLWGPLWRDWLTSVDHKRIGIMYVVLAFVMLLRGVLEGAVMRTQQAAGLGGGFLTPEHFGELFSTYGTIMVFFVAMPFVAGLINYVMPLQIGARDVSFPVMNQISLPTEATIAHVLVSKYADHLPLYRQSQILARAGLDLHRAVLADWVGKAAFHLKPVVDRLADHLKRSGKLFMPSRQHALHAPAG